MCCKSFLGQIKISDQAYNVYQNIAQEKIYIHTNSNFLLTGETLTYKVYCLKYDSNLFSNFSKIAYLELINSDKQSVLKQKINLEKSVGFGDAFIPTNLASGNYKLIAYTTWMKNKNYFFEESINIINPFIDKIIAETSKNTKNTESDSKKNIPTYTANNGLLKTNKTQYSKREQVHIKVSENFKNSISGDFSLSVRKIMPNFSTKKTNPLNFNQPKNNQNTANQNTENNVFFPELRGELIQGKIVALTNYISLENIPISLSIIQKNGIYKIVNTNKKGEFYFNLPEEYSSNKAIIQILNKHKNSFKIIISEPNPVNLDALKFTAIHTNQEINKSIKERAIYVQIENGYNELNKDTILPSRHVVSPFKNHLIIYNLNDYTRFKTVKETIVEVVKNTWITKEADNYTFHVRDIDLLTNYDNKPLVLIDGYTVYNHNELVNLNPKKIKQIAIVRNKYKHNTNIYQGVISVKTFEGNFTPDPNENSVSVALEKPLPRKKYFLKNYNQSNFKRIPDYRTQLYWNPTINLKEENISFFTSDVTGNFEIVLEGFSENGNPMYEKIFFTVQ